MDNQTNVTVINPSFVAGVEFAKSGNVAEARRSFENSLREKPEDPDTWSWLAWTYESPQQAVAALEQAVELAPRHALAAAGLTWLKGLESQMATALEKAAVADAEAEIAASESALVDSESPAPMPLEIEEQLADIETALDVEQSRLEHAEPLIDVDTKSNASPTLASSTVCDELHELHDSAASDSCDSAAHDYDGTSLPFGSCLDSDCVDLLCRQEQLLQRISESQDTQDVIVCAFQMLTTFLDFAVAHLNDGCHTDVEELLQSVLLQTQEFEQLAKDEGWKRANQLIEQGREQQSELSKKYDALKASYSSLHATFFLRCVEKFDRGPAQVEFLQAVDLFLTELKDRW